MNTTQRQRGMTMWGATFVISVFAFTLFIGFKLFLPYMNDFKIKGAFESMARQGVLSMPKMEIVSAMYKRFSVDNIDNINLEKELVVEVRGSTQVVKLDYEVEIPIVHNLYIVLKFNHEKQASTGG